MQIHDVKKKKIDGKQMYIYDGIYDDKRTKWITKTQWDFKLTKRFDKKQNKIIYIDSKGNEIKMVDEDDDAFTRY